MQLAAIVPPPSEPAVPCFGVSFSLGVSEKVWDAYTGVQNIFGYAWTLLMQDMLQVPCAKACVMHSTTRYPVFMYPTQFDLDTDQALSRIATANRTCAYVHSLL